MTVARPAGRAQPAKALEFEEFYRSHADRLYRALALTLGDTHLAKEATDEATARAYARWPTVSRLENPGGWAYRVGLNWATSWRRKVRRERPMPPSDPREGEPATGGSGGVEALRLLAALPVPQRVVIVCRVLLDMSTVETARLLGVADGTVKSRLARGLSALRSTLTEEMDNGR
ncbi:MAG: RNA polymerase sigma factor [Micromonosporaceae bacterium]|nr:RNA polymerase sigma factor [Micromonosporaceae bacterium]